MDLSIHIMEKEGVSVENIRIADHTIPHGILPDMSEEGYDQDDWPGIYQKVLDADILVIGSPIWLGTLSSVAKKTIERLDANSAETNVRGQTIYYNKVGGCIVTGNEDGAKSVASDVLYAMQHIGFSIPPQADAAWLGKVGPGPSYLDDESNAKNHEFTNRNVTFMTYNMLHLASMLNEFGGYSDKGNSMEAWQNGERWSFRKH
jgi:multimeric flavodoxin WrbA